MATSLSTSGLHLTHDSFGPFESTTQTASRSVQPLFTAHECNKPIDRPTDRLITLLGR